MGFSSWFCPNNTKTMFVKIVHPGGHVELHDRPVHAAEIMLQNPKYCVAYPHVFRQPSAVVPPETILMPGQKFYVVPLNTIRKLRRKHSPSLVQEVQTSQHGDHQEHESSMNDSCWLFRSKNSPKLPYACSQQSNSYETQSESKEMKKDGFHKNDDNCFTCFLTGIMIKASNGGSNKKTILDTGSGSSETRILANDNEASPNRVRSFHAWKPSLESVCEE